MSERVASARIAHRRRVSCNVQWTNERNIPMANSQISEQNRPQSKRKESGGRQQGVPVAAFTGADTDVEDDELFGLVSVLYHALQGASASRKYINDAENAA